MCATISPNRKALVCLCTDKSTKEGTLIRFRTRGDASAALVGSHNFLLFGEKVVAHKENWRPTALSLAICFLSRQINDNVGQRSMSSLVHDEVFHVIM